MARRSPARFAAPLALAVFIVILVVVVLSAGGGSSSGGVSGHSGRPAARTSPRVKHRRGGTRRTYVVRSGDSLARIAAKTGVPIKRIEQLNRGIDARTLHPGEKIKLRP